MGVSRFIITYSLPLDEDVSKSRPRCLMALVLQSSIYNGDVESVTSVSTSLLEATMIASS